MTLHFLKQSESITFWVSYLISAALVTVYICVYVAWNNQWILMCAVCFSEVFIIQEKIKHCKISMLITRQMGKLYAKTVDK